MSLISCRRVAVDWLIYLVVVCALAAMFILALSAFGWLVMGEWMWLP